MRGDKCDGVEAAVTLADAAVNYGLSMRESGASLFLLGERTNKITTLANVIPALPTRVEQLAPEDAPPELS